MKIELYSLDKTGDLGCRLGRTARPGDIITLAGDLGAGKTTLTQFIGRGLEVPSSYYITSPTFNLLQEYPGRLPFYHIDLYRLTTVDEFEDLGFEEYMYGEGLTVIEWPDRLGGLMPADRLEIELTIKSETARSAELICHGTYLLPDLIRELAEPKD
ncbi:MAG: tRNA (adenosine(37)-N6)-threonylcarbamoyltransferase complex ATPase subunit type 1 TsaE [Desulfurivibrionaceae bacterium]